jgi:hypothetical protein
VAVMVATPTGALKMHLAEPCSFLGGLGSTAISWAGDGIDGDGDMRSRLASLPVPDAASVDFLLQWQGLFHTKRCLCTRAREEVRNERWLGR